MITTTGGDPDQRVSGHRGVMMNQELEELHNEWQVLATRNGQLLASKDEIEERMAKDARTLAQVNAKLQALENEKLGLLPRLAEAAMAVHGTCATTGASGPRLPPLSHMR